MSDRKLKPWKIIFTDWDPDKQALRETLCTLGNGKFATRGAFEEVSAGGPHYPGTYVAGGYNRLETPLKGHVLENEDLVNWPNWLPLRFRVQGGEWFSLDTVNILEFSVTLDMQNGLLHRHLHFTDKHSREFSLDSRRLVHMQQPHVAAMEWQLTAHNWSGQLEFQTSIDGSITNGNVERYSNLKSKHLDVLKTGYESEDAIYLTAQTTQSHLRMTQATRTRAFDGDQPVAVKRHREQKAQRVTQRLTIPCEQQKQLRLEKIAAIVTSNDFAISETCIAARSAIRRAESFSDLFESHSRQWKQLWSCSDIELRNGDTQTQCILRLHIFHLLQTASPNTIDRDVGVPARGWHGEAYRGHIFWDELFVLPLLTFRIPQVTRSLLMYRYRRLPAARHLAEDAGYRGAMYPWQSGSDGTEESQELHLNPRSGRWVPDETHLQRHVNAAIAYNVWTYFEASNDMEFFSYYGAEMILELARFWASISTYNSERDRYEIRNVVGPDEFHVRYPNSDEPGLHNNAYTNVMAVWVLRAACGALNILDEQRRHDLRDDLRIDDEELVRWKHISSNMFVPFHDDGIISQFEGYEDLKEFDWEGYREKYDDIQRLDRILEAEGDDVNHYKASKQADVLMLLYLFSAEELERLFDHMGYEFDTSTIPRNIDYYVQRTSHGSTLSRIVHSWVLARADREGAWNLFNSALKSDIEDIQGGTTSEGIHLGAMAGTVDLMQRAHTGLSMRDDALWFDPCLPKEVSAIEFRIRYRGHWLSVEVTDKKLTISFDRGWSTAVNIGCAGDIVKMTQGETRSFSL